MRKTVLAVPKNCALAESGALLARAGIVTDPLAGIQPPRLRLATSCPDLEIVLVRNWDTLTLAKMGAVDLALVGSDVLCERGAAGVVPLLDLNTGRCRLSLAASADRAAALAPGRRVRVATSYPATTQRYFRSRGMQAECIVLQGSVELAPSLRLSECVVDIVATGRTLRENGLVELERIAEVSTRLVAARNYHASRPADAARWRERLGSATLHPSPKAAQPQREPEPV